MSDIEGFEYNIKFPSSNFQYDKNILKVDKQKLPIILLFGWAGCEDKYLSKYSKIYEDQGLITLRYITPVSHLMWKRWAMTKMGHKLVNLLVDLNFQTHPVLVHCFSNGGAFTYQHFCAALQKSSKDIQINGVIFDSSPGRRSFIKLYRAISTLIGGYRLFNISITMLCTILISISCRLEEIWFYPNYLGDPYVALMRDQHFWPQHFIYSKADELINYEDVEDFRNYRQSRGVEVSSTCFEKSEHVKHYLDHGDSYKSSIFTFIKNCLNLEKKVN